MIKKRFGTQEMTFSERVVAIARMIPKGRVMTYGDIARAAQGGAPSAQSVTSILGKAYDHGITDIPFHRIVYADGRVWLDAKHHKERMKRYAEEGIPIDERGRIVGFEAVRWDPRER